MPEEKSQIPEQLAPDEHARNRGIVEALLIVSDLPLGAARLASVLGRQVGAREVRAYVDDLNCEYIGAGRSFRITEVAGGLQLTVHTEYAPWVRQLMREKSPARLSHAAVETMAIIAFKQPVTKAEMEHIRGVDVDGVLRNLLEKGLVRISGRSEGVGRPLLYGTTREFLKHFGLKTLSDLPKLRELEELLREEEPQMSLAGLRGEGHNGDEAHDERRTDDEPEAEASAEGSGAEGMQAEPSGRESGQGTAEPVSGAGGHRIQEGERPADSGGGDSG